MRIYVYLWLCTSFKRKSSPHLSLKEMTYTKGTIFLVSFRIEQMHRDHIRLNKQRKENGQITGSRIK